MAGTIDRFRYRHRRRGMVSMESGLDGRNNHPHIDVFNAAAGLSQWSPA